MKQLEKVILALFMSVLLTNCNGQSNYSEERISSSVIVGGGCDGCELMYEGMPAKISSTSYSPGWEEEGQKLLITGTVFRTDGKTPEPNVVIYYWQTDNRGYYSTGPELSKKASRHGHIRGWVQTDSEGKYSIYTIRPAPYPNSEEPAHIHISIKEPAIDNEYYIDALVFDDDRLLTSKKRKSTKNRGGSGVLRILLSDDFQIAEHNIILGLNIPDYPVEATSGVQSGLSIGEDNPSFTPFHAWGPDKGTKTCPVCKYGRYHGIVYFVGNKPIWNDIKKWLLFLEEQSIERIKYLKVYFVYGNENSYSENDRRSVLEQIGKDLKLKNIALTFVSSFSDSDSEVNLNKINSEVENTFIIYRNRNIIDKYIDLDPSVDNFRLISNSLDQTQGEYFYLPEPPH